MTFLTKRVICTRKFYRKMLKNYLNKVQKLKENAENVTCKRAICRNLLISITRVFEISDCSFQTPEGFQNGGLFKTLHPHLESAKITKLGEKEKNSEVKFIFCVTNHMHHEFSQTL